MNANESETSLYHTSGLKGGEVFVPVHCDVDKSIYVNPGQTIANDFLKVGLGLEYVIFNSIGRTLRVGR